MTLRRIVAFILIVAVIAVAWHFLTVTLAKPDPRPGLEDPSPALGQTVAAAIHQAVTDPYFAPIERMVAYLNSHPDVGEVSIGQMTNWSTDDELPTSFVWDVERGKLQFNRPSSPWALEAVEERLRQGLGIENPRRLLYVDTFSVEGDRYWLGFIQIPLGSGHPRQMAGALLNIDHYLERDVPRLVDNVVARPRFPLVPFQRSEPPMHGERDGDISIRILKKNGEVYLQRGRNFDPEKMIFSESRYYPNPIVCLQEGWDLQVFSSNVRPPRDVAGNRRRAVVILIAMLGLVAVFYWWGATARTGVKGGVRSSSKGGDLPD